MRIGAKQFIIAGLSLSFITLEYKSERTKERIKVTIAAGTLIPSTLIILSLLLQKSRSVL
jgi:hypothetical protein